MSHPHIIAEVTAALKNHLQASLTPAIGNRPGGLVPAVTTRSPAKLDDEQAVPGVNLFLYQVLPDPIQRNIGVERNPGVMAARDLELVLYYLVTFSGDESALEPQRMLGEVIRSLHQEPVLSVGKSPESEFVQILTHEGADPLVVWSRLTDAAYRLSLLYMVRGVGI